MLIKPLQELWADTKKWIDDMADRLKLTSAQVCGLSFACICT